MTGTVFDIKEFSLHDGPGARVTVFLKGCPLRCQWCHNPEGLLKRPQLMYKEATCVHCGRCYKPCNHPECQAVGRCVHICANNCLEITGREYAAQALCDRLLPYVPFLKLNDGGITFSGGEPMMQAEFLCELIQLLKRQSDIHVAVQTSGYTDADTFQKVVGQLDYVMLDIKLADRKAHKRYTGVYNDRIIENFRWLKSSGKEFLIRVPLIPDITDTEENLKGISHIIGDSPCELLSYNKLASAKYSMLGMEYTIEKQENRQIDLSIFTNAKLS